MSVRERGREITAYAIELGYTLQGRTTGGHLKFTHPNLKGAVFIAPHSEEFRAMKNAMGQLKRGVQGIQTGAMI